MASVRRRWAQTIVLFMVLLIQGIMASDEDIPKPVTSIFPDSEAITSFSPGGQYIMLTFDSTPHSKHTDKILDALSLKNASATFFVYGTKSSNHPHLIRRLVEPSFKLLEDARYIVVIAILVIRALPSLLFRFTIILILSPHCFLFL